MPGETKMKHERIEGESSNPLLDARIWRRNRIDLASPAERTIHLLGFPPVDKIDI
jgi:hypothetical protein